VGVLSGREFPERQSLRLRGASCGRGLADQAGLIPVIWKHRAFWEEYRDNGVQAVYISCTQTERICLVVPWNSGALKPTPKTAAT
jgi:hypothetical protein